MKDFDRKIRILFFSFLLPFYFLFLWGKGNKKEPLTKTKEIERKTAGNKKETEENYLLLKEFDKEFFSFSFFFRFISFLAAKRK